MTLDRAIKEAAAQVNTRIPAKTKVALISVASSSPALAEYIIGRLEAALVDSGVLTVMDRANLDKVRAEQGFQMSGEVRDESAKAIGRLLGAGAIVTGSFVDLGDAYGLTLKAINMETAAVAVSFPADIAKNARIETLMASGGGAGGGATASGGTAKAPTSGGGTATPAVPATPAKTYKIGNTVPGGGLVFYDKGNASGGWRYMEVT
jgi:hypothetical protein